MTLPTPKYQIGDTVYSVTCHVSREETKCPDCLGEKTWSVTTPSGDSFKVTCPSCCRWSSNHRRYVAKYQAEVQKLTIGSVQIDTADDEPIRYMCKETGIGSGSVYHESKLFDTREDAQREAELQAREQEEQDNKRRGVTQQDRNINRMTILDAKVADAERKVQEIEREFRKWEWFLDDFEFGLIPGEDGRGFVDGDVLAHIAEHIREKFKEKTQNLPFGPKDA